MLVALIMKHPVDKLSILILMILDLLFTVVFLHEIGLAFLFTSWHRQAYKS